MAKDEMDDAPRLISETEFNKLLKKLKTSQTKLDESKGEMGAAIEAAISKHNVHKDALRVVRKYLKKDPTAAAEFITHLDTYWEYAKLADGETDLVETKPERKSRIKGETADEPDKSNVTKLGRGTHVIRDGGVHPIEQQAG